MREQRAPKRLVVGIQARSTSHRLPGKVHATLGKTSVLSRVISAVAESAEYVNKNLRKHLNLDVSFCLLVPTGDVIKKTFSGRIIEGDENDVLSRYKKMADMLKPDYIVRITADCPLIPSPVITNVIKVGATNEYDYAANFFEKSGSLYRMVADGYECEFMSARMLAWLSANAVDARDREHVTTLARSYPDGFNFGVIIPHVYQGDKKLSVDTIEDLERIRKEWELVDKARETAEVMFGKTKVHRY